MRNFKIVNQIFNIGQNVGNIEIVLNNNTKFDIFMGHIKRIDIVEGCGREKSKTRRENY